LNLVRDVNLWATEYSGALVIGLVLLLTVLALLFLRLNANLHRLIRRYNQLMRGVDASNLEVLLSQQVELTREQEVRLAELGRTCAELSALAKKGLQHVGLVRFNAFTGVGGNQSFSLALLDEGGSGFVLSSLFGRLESAMYCKAVERGRPVLAASHEEEEAIRQALASESVQPQ
jgi:hypothetical protein